MHEIVRGENRSHCGTVLECRTRDPEVPIWILVHTERNLSQEQSKQYHHQSLCTRVTYLKWSEAKTSRHQGNFKECRTREPEGPSSNPDMGKKNMSHMCNKNNTTTYPSVPELNTWNCSEVKTRSHWGTGVECKTTDPVDTISNPNGEVKENFS